MTSGESALRAAANNPQGRTPEAIKFTAKNRMQQLITGCSAASELGQLNAEAGMVLLALTTITAAFGAISYHMGTVQETRDQFYKECKAGLGTFMFPTNKPKLSNEERLMQTFTRLITTDPQLARYVSFFGFQSDTIPDNPNYLFYWVLPFYRMRLDQPVASTLPIDKQRMAINLLFQCGLPKWIGAVDEDFQDDSGFVSFFESLFQQDNYLNDFRSKRFILMCLANLLWNLQHPVDPETGYPLSTDVCIKLCKDVEIFLNEFLIEHETQPLPLQNPHERDLFSIIRQIETHTKDLHAAYVDQAQHELNIDDITTNAHCTLRIMVTSLLSLIFFTKDPSSKQKRSDHKAAEDLIYTVSHLNELLKYNPSILSVFKGWEVSTPYKNTPSATIIDILINFIHCTEDQKLLLLLQLENHKSVGVRDFGHILKGFNTRYVLPLQEFSKKHLKTTVKFKEIAAQTARWLIPLITLVADDYRIDLHTHLAPESSHQAPPIHAQDQITAINKMAEKGGDYFLWELSPYITISANAEALLDKLPQALYRFTEITKLLDALAEIIKNYRSFLQLKSFQQFLKECVRKVRLEYQAIERHIKEISQALSNDASISRNLHSVLAPMTRDLTESLDAFEKAATSFANMVRDPDFTKKQRDRLQAKLRDLQEQFSELFDNDLHLELHTLHQDLDNNAQLFAAYFPMPTLNLDNENALNSRSVIALRNLIMRCYDALSLQSQITEKGRLLRELVALVDKEEYLTPREARHLLRELARVTLAYRPGFFQADYGETRSGKVFREAILDKNLNNILPIGFLLFNSPTDVTNETSEQILLRLKSLRKTQTHQWEESSEDIANVGWALAQPT